MKFTETHEWIEVQNGIGTVGVTDYAQKELGDIVYVELPEVGKKVKAGEEAAVLESTKAAADIYSPVSGEIVAVNSLLSEASEKINQSPEKDGWIFKIKIADAAELEDLMERTAYQSSIQ
jgi:glycine cleavage system H protein